MDSNVDYRSINRAINDVFFDGRFAGQPVYLSLDQEMRGELASSLGLDEDGLEDAICACVGSYLKDRGNPYEGVLYEASRWKRGGMASPPPFTALLFTLAHAAAIMAAEGNFASNNYYRRLAQVTGHDKQPLSIHGRWTEELWADLNDWLLDHNYELGRPTARAINSWTYVGIAISQAIVRAGDRVLFHDMFERYGFSGNEGISVQEMRQYLSHWMGTSRPNTRLRNAWKNEDLRDRVCEAAIAELVSWSSGTARRGTTGGAQAKTTKLSLLANLVPKFPKNILELHLGRVGDGDPRGPYALEGSDGRFFLSNDRFGGFLTIGTAPFGAGNKGLSQVFSFEAVQDEQRLEWRPRLLIPLAKSQQGSAWVEVSRVTFGVQHMLLVRDTRNLPAEVEAFLMGAAISRPRRASYGDVPGLPQGWILYEGVQVKASAVQPSKDLECLVPLGEEGTLTVSGGMQLQSSFYHPGTSITATMVAPSGPVQIVASMDESGASLQAAELGMECALEIDSSGFSTGGAVSITGWQDGRVVDTKELFFRDADRPNRLGSERNSRLSYRSITSASESEDTSAVRVEGMSAVGIVEGKREPRGIISDALLPSGSAEEIQATPLSFAVARQVSRETCVERGYHIWRFPIVPSNTPAGTPFEGICSDCKQGLFVVYRRRKQIPQDVRPLRIELPPIQPPKTEAAIDVDYDQLLDALCFLGTGSWGKFEALLEVWPSSSAYPRDIAERLFVLGFLDLQLRPGTNAIRSWSVPPPTLNFITEDRGYLSGFRSNRLLERIGESIGAHGGRFRVIKFEGRPRMALVEGIDPNSAVNALSTVRDPLGRQVSVEVGCAMRLADACSVMDGIESATVPVSVGRPKDLQRFDVRMAKWQDISSISGPGAYRWNDGMQAYAYLPSSGDALMGPYQVVKLMAARGEHVRLHAYEPHASSFVATLGSEPPGLLARALVACSGQLPTLGRGVVTFRSVTPEVAEVILSILYPGG